MRIIIVIIICLFVLLFIYGFCKSKIYLNKLKSVKLENISPNTGDIILFSTDNIKPNNILQIFYNHTPFTHVGIVYKKDGIVYLLESHPTHYGDTSGIQLHPFYKRIKEYKGKLFYRRKKVSPSKNQEKLLENFVIEHNGYPEFPSTTTLLSNYINRCMIGNEDLKPPYNCAEIVSIIFNKIFGHHTLRIGCEGPNLSSFDKVLEKPVLLKF